MRGILWVPWRNILITLVEILSTAGYRKYRGGYSVPWGYHDACGEYQEYRGDESFVIWVPHGTHDTPHMYHDTPHMYHDIPHGTEHPWYSLISSTVLIDIPHDTYDISHGTHDIPHGTEHPPRYWTHIIQGAFVSSILNLKATGR